jgi:hypothetical protein
MPPRRGWNFVWVVVLQRCRADGAAEKIPRGFRHSARRGESRRVFDGQKAKSVEEIM